MRKHIFQFVIIIQSIFIISMLSSCSNSMFTKETKQYFDDVYKEANEYFQQSDYDNAKKILLNGISKAKPQKSPEIQFEITPVNEKNDKKNIKEVARVKTKNLVEIKAIQSYQNLYHLLGKIYIKENNYNNALLYLDTCIYMRDDLPLVWSDIILVHTLNHNYDKAKEIGSEAIKLFEKNKNKSEVSIIYRQLGYLAIQENDLIKAEEYYNKSLEYIKSDEAYEQLKYIKTLKDKK